MSNKTVGISDIGIHIPSPGIDLERLIKERVTSDPRLERHLQRAVRTTGQKVIRFPNLWEDTTTMAAQAARNLLLRGHEEDLAGLRYLVAGTETTVDHSKPISAYVQGLLQRSGLELPNSLTSFQVQHACAGGTLSLLSVASLLSASGWEGESGLVLASDIARYQLSSTAEITQGAGAVSLLVEKSPRLLSLEIGEAGYCSQDVDDFFRPLGCKIAQVKGRYSMEVYQESLESAFLDHCRRSGQRPEDVLESTDLFVLHTPFRNMPELAMKQLLRSRLGLEAEAAEVFLAQRGFYAGVDPIARIGNTYSASLYLFLAFLLKERYDTLGEEIVGSRVLLASYGSGNTMVVLSGQVTPSAPQVIAAWDLDRIFASARTATMEEYHVWAAGPYASGEYERLMGSARVPVETFYLSGVREDGYREYKYAADSRDWLPERETSVDLRRPVAVLR
jgi:hydroxymethylglutaryl-CoA synthase